ncbi:PIN domain nuclease [Piscinibacter sp. Jin2]|uniref:Ribonuclease VapC n=1 Tax=Aquariibacter lacus TaxID=2801332 RepID=A0A9X1BS74_9BURK|nr:PIN domain nuclease [Piscinibacter lacus]MBL0720709.1 PIN domain nuclease [Piscinibacter lacus]
MILVDSSVWVDYFRGTVTPQTDALDGLLGVQPLLMGDLILAEVLQGFDREADFRRARELLARFECRTLGGADIALQAAQHFRSLRARGHTVRRTIDCLIATRCIAEGWTLLDDDRDYAPFAQHLGLRRLLPSGS